MKNNRVNKWREIQNSDAQVGGKDRLLIAKVECKVHYYIAKARQCKVRSYIARVK